MVRQRSKAGQGKGKWSLSRKNSTSSLTENFTGKEEGMVWTSQVSCIFTLVYTLSCCIKFIFSPGWNEPDTPVDGTPIVSEPLEKVKKRYRKKKNKLEEAFPSYLQVSPTNIPSKCFSTEIWIIFVASFFFFF